MEIPLPFQCFPVEGRPDVRRFPLSIIAGLIGSMIAIYLVELELFESNLCFVNLLLTLAFRHPTFFPASKSFRNSPATLRTRTLIQPRGILFLGVIVMEFPANFSFDTNRIPYIQILGLYLTSIFSVRNFCLFPKIKNQL